MTYLDKYLSELDLPPSVPSPTNIQNNVGLTKEVKKKLRFKHFKCLKGCAKLLQMGASRVQFMECKQKCKYENYLKKADTISKKLNYSAGERVKTLYRVLKGD
jgi:hypothetical protein